MPGRVVLISEATTVAIDDAGTPAGRIVGVGYRRSIRHGYALHPVQDVISEFVVASRIAHLDPIADLIKREGGPRVVGIEAPDLAPQGVHRVGGPIAARIDTHFDGAGAVITERRDATKWVN